MSIRKRTWSNAKGEEKTAWVVDYVDGMGKRRLKTFDRKKEADAFAATAAVEIRQGVHVADSASASIEVAGDLWLKSARSMELERSTVTDYERHLRLHIVPFIGSVKLSSLSIARVRAFEDELRGGGRSASMTKRILVTLGTLIADAQERGLVARNVVRDMKGRRGSGESRLEKRQKGKLKVGVDIPTREEMKALLAVVEGRWRPLILTAAFSGLRASELRGLRWSDVDFDKREIHVRQRADRFNAIGQPKSISGERTLPVPPIVINALREWKLACPRSEGLDLCFPNGSGKVEQLSNILRRGLHPAWIKAGLSIDTGEKDEDGNPILEPKYSGLHALRHWFASWCINSKADGGLELPPKVVQERMGHSTIALTMDTYSHLFPRADAQEEMAAAERAFFL